jgi:glycosyltransferase involved in cell wall biosynthesis
LKKLAIIVSHPIQYYSPVFALLAKNGWVDVKVFYTMGEGPQTNYDPGFGKQIKWDIPLLEGYNYEFLDNEAHNPGTHHFMGIITPDAVKRLEIYKPDAILIYGWGFYSHLKIIRYFKNKIPVWFRGDSTLLDHSSRLKSMLRSVFLKWIYKHVDKAFYVGSANKDYFLKYGLDSKQLYFAPHSVDNTRFADPHLENAFLLRRKFNISDESILILFAGKFESKKAPMELLQSFKSLGAVNVHLLFTGNGVLEQELKSEAAGCSKIHFHDFVNQSQIPAFYQASDLFCLPSKGPGETWGLAVNEAMAAGKAILVSDKAGCAIDLVRNNQNGLIFKSDQNDALANALKYLVSDKQRLFDMGNISREIIKKYNFTEQIEVIERQTLAI